MFKKSIKVTCCIGILLFLCGVTAFGQESKCKEELRNGEKVIVCEVYESNPYPLGPVRIPNDTKVVIRMINKSPFDDCTLSEVKLTPIPEIDPIEAFLKLFMKTVTGTIVSGSPTKAVGDANTLSKQLRNQSENLAENLKTSRTNTSDLLKDIYEPLVRDIMDIVVKRPINPADFTAQGGDALIVAVQSQLNKDKDNVSEPDDKLTTKYLEEFMNKSQAEYDLIREQVKGISDDTEVIHILNNLAIANGRLDALKTNIEAIGIARSLFGDLIKKKANTADAYIQEFPAFLPYSQQAASSSVTCTNTITKKVVYSQIPVTFLYKKDSRLSVSVGPLFSTGSKQKLGITQINTGLNTMGQPSFRNEFAVVDRASYQIIPFAFLNYRLKYLGNNSNPTKLSDFSVNISGGIGVNPNSGTNEVEYFIGPSIGYKKFLFQFGDHVGRFQKGFTGGFNIGDTVPANFPAILPIQKEYRHRFSIGVSYRLF